MKRNVSKEELEQLNYACKEHYGFGNAVQGLCLICEIAVIIVIFVMITYFPKTKNPGIALLFIPLMILFYYLNSHIVARIEANKILNGKFSKESARSTEIAHWLGQNKLVDEFPELVEAIKKDEGHALAALIRDGYFIDEYHHSKSAAVRVAIAKQGKYLDEYVNDESFIVRCTVAEQGYGLNKLCNDKDSFVSKKAKEMLAEYDTKNQIAAWMAENQEKLA